jgi:hypothetical protein
MNMFWSRRNPKASEEIRAPDLRFVGEQDGQPERRLKERLTAFFERDKSVKAAYLAKVDLGMGNSATVALCLRAQFGADKGMVEKIGAIFALTFDTSEHLDIIFLTDVQETLLQKVCKPFFGREVA